MLFSGRPWVGTEDGGQSTNWQPALSWPPGRLSAWFFGLWGGAWLKSWIVAFLVVLVIAPLARKLVGKLTD